MASEQHHAIIATTWCVDSASAMNQWCASIPGMRTVRSDSPSDRLHTLVLLTNESLENDALRNLFLEALLEDDDWFEEPRWTYVEVNYGAGGPSVGRAYPMTL